MNPTVAHLLPDYNPFPPVYPAGTELRVEQVARRQRRYRPLVVCGWFPGQAQSESLDAMRVRRIYVSRVYRRLFQKITRLDPVPYAARMWRVLEEEGAALAHIHNEPKLLAGLFPRFARSRIPLVMHIANEKPLPEFALERVTRWVACSRYIARWLTEANGLPSSAIEVIYTGVDSRGLRPQWELAAEARRALRRRYGIESDRITALVYAGRLVKEKGVAELLDAFARLRAMRGERVELLLAGNVRASDDPMNEKAAYGKAVVARAEKTAGARWVGSLAPRDVHDFLLAGDLFVMPSLWDDPFPTAMLEAAAAGLPIVAAARGGITEFLEGCPGVAFVADPADPQSLAAAIDGYVGEPQRRSLAARWLREKVERGFDWSRVCEECESLYDRLLAPPPQPSPASGGEGTEGDGTRNRAATA